MLGKRNRLRLVAAFATVCTIGVVHDAGTASTVSPAAPPWRPGPNALWAPPTVAPQLTNAGVWRAEPLLVSGAGAHRDGEFLWQDFVHDAHGADTTPLPLLPPDTSPSATAGLASAPTGDVAQPTDHERYGRGAADLLEIRARPVPGGTAYRITLQTMKAADASVVAIGIDRDRDPATGRDDWGAGVGRLGRLGLEHVLVAWGTGAAIDGLALPVRTDLARNQIEVTVPLAPGPVDRTWRHYAVAGIHDGRGGFAPVLDEPTAMSPGGAHGATPPPVLNVGFRSAAGEPMGTDLAEVGGRGAYGYGSWRDHAQAKALAARDIAAFHADVDFDLLARGGDVSTVPSTGFLDRLVSSRQGLGEGLDAGGAVLLGDVQPYAIYVPSSYRPGTPAPVVLALHSAATNYNQYGVQTPKLLRQLGEERDAIVVTPEARGPTVGYGPGMGETDVFEVLADVRRRYDVDLDRVLLTGISMGGIGTYRLASVYPDLFGAAFPIAGHGADVVDLAPNVEHVPLLAWNGVPDELVHVTDAVAYPDALRGLGYRHELALFPLVDHLVRPLGTGTDWSVPRRWAGAARVVRAPAHVRYHLDRTRGTSDHVYWVGDIRTASGVGDVDATSLARTGVGRTAVPYDEPGSEPEAHLKRGVRWEGATTTAPVGNGVVLDIRGVTSLAIDALAAGLDPGEPVALVVTSDRAATIRLRWRGTRADEAIPVTAGRTGTTG